MNFRTFINDFIKIKKQKKYSEMSEREKFEVFASLALNQEVFNYLKSHFDNLTIEILGKYAGNIMELMNLGVLCGWCWQTTETAVLFLEDDVYIERGNLKFEKDKNYYHSWIVFNFKGIEYVFDPCLQILCEKNIYDKVFEIEVKGKVTARQVKDYFINYITNPPKEERTKEQEESYQRTHHWLVRLFGEEAFERSKGEIIIHDEEDVNAPIYRNGVGYKATLENGKVKKLVAHYYFYD